MGVVKTSQLGRDHEPVPHDTHRRDAASILFNLPGYRVISAWHEEEGQRVVLIETLATEDGCPSCGVMSSRVRSRPVQQVEDVTCGGEPVVVRVRKRRYSWTGRAACRESG